LIAALLFQLPSDGIASQGAQPAAQNSSALVEMIQNSGPVAMAVLVLLLIASLYSWSVILGKMSTFRKATRESQRFIRAFRKATRLQEMATVAEECKASPLAQVFEEVYETYKRQTGGSGPPRNLAPLERSAQTAASEAITSLERRLTWLANDCIREPVRGAIRHGHRHCGRLSRTGTAGAATLRAVAPGISEALITTAAGLFVAIPAVIAYNQFTARIRVFAAAIDDFCRELLNSLEEIPVRVAKAAKPGAPANPEAGGEAVREVDSGLYK